MKLLVFFTLLTKAFSDIVFSISAQPFSFQCVNNKLSIFGLNMFIKGSVNNIPFALPMDELGLPTINMDWFVNGNSASQLSVLNSFNIDNSITSQNRWSFQLKDDQPNIGAGTVQLGPCVQGTTYSITASFSSTSFITGVGFPALNLPPASGVPVIVNNLSPQNIPGNPAATTQITTQVTTNLRTTIPTTPPLTTKTVSSIIFSISAQLFNYQCVNNKLSIFGLNMFVKGSINGIPFNLPMIELGLPIIDMVWFVNKNPASLSVLNIFNVDNSQISQNKWTFMLKDDQGNIGAGTIQLGPCVKGVTYVISAAFSSNSFITGVGVPALNLPPATGVPVIVNNLAPQNRQ